MLGANVWRRIIGVDKATVIESVEVTGEEDAVVVCVRPRRATKRRCGRCGEGAPGYDQGEGRRRWRAIDLGVVCCYLEADSPRVDCPTHGAIVARVVAAGRAAHDPFSGLVRIGIDELSYKRGQRYLVVVVCHDTGRLVWCGIGREKKTLNVWVPRTPPPSSRNQNRLLLAERYR